MRRRQLQDGVRLTLSSEIPSKKKLKETKTYVQCILLYGIKKEIPTIRVALQKTLPSCPPSVEVIELHRPGDSHQTAWNALLCC